MYSNFEVIDILDDTNPYPALFGIDWGIDNQIIINFKKRILTFEYSELRVVALIDLLEGQRYIDPVNNEGKGNYLYHIDNIKFARDDYVNPIADGNLSWRIIISCTSYFGEALEKLAESDT